MKRIVILLIFGAIAFSTLSSCLSLIGSADAAYNKAYNKASGNRGGGSGDGVENDGSY
ncbi:MAG: hypothetical protein IJV08_09265 [Bacteroidaceae bacterium]|nr:hypothetical protein [Bacteroidaceae bacterium]